MASRIERSDRITWTRLREQVCQLVQAGDAPAGVGVPRVPIDQYCFRPFLCGPSQRNRRVVDDHRVRSRDAEAIKDACVKLWTGLGGAREVGAEQSLCEQLPNAERAQIAIQL